MSGIVEELKEQIKEQLGEEARIRNGQEALRVEKAVHEHVVRVGDEVFAELLKEAHEDEAFRRQALMRAREEQPQHQWERLARVKVQLLGGSKAELCTPYLLGPRAHRRRTRGRAGSGFYPLLEALGIHERVSAACQAEVARQVVECSSLGVACHNLHERGIKLAPKVCRRIAYALGRRALARREALVRGDRTSGHDEHELLSGRRIAVCTDGGRCRYRRPKRGKRKANRHRRYHTEWKEPKLFIIYVLDHKGRADKSVPPLCDGTTGDADALFALLQAYLRAYGAARAEQIVFINDGGPWIWNRIEPLIDALGWDSEKVLQVLDFWHAAQHLNEALQCCKHLSEQRRKSFFVELRSMLRRGRVSEVLDILKHYAKGRRAKGINKVRRYLSAHLEHMRYDHFAAISVPLGSGAIESAIRRVVNLRLKGASKFWRQENAEIVLHLRCQLKSRRWQTMLDELLMPPKPLAEERLAA